MWSDAYLWYFFILHSYSAVDVIIILLYDIMWSDAVFSITVSERHVQCC